MMNRKRLKSPKQKPDAVSIVIGILLGVYVLGLLLPTIWAALTAFMDVKSYQQAYLFSNFENGKFPFKFTLENFVIANDFLEVQAVNTGEFWYADTMYINSLKFALFSAVSFTACCTLVSYLTAKFDFKFSKIIYGFVIVAMSLPIVGSMPSEIRMLQRLGIYNTWLSIPILRFNFLNVYFLVLFATFRGISKEYSEAAKIDGASNMRIMLRIVMPQALNIIVTIFFLSFINYWNDYQVPMLYLPDYPVAAYGLFDFLRNNTDAASYATVKMAGTLILTLPVLLLVIIFNKRLRVSVSIGGIKG